MSHPAGSNCGPPLYESGALPTELGWLRICVFYQIHFIRNLVQYIAMRLAVIGPQNTGKTTFIKDFIKAFPQYKTPKETYRDLVKKNKLKINRETDQETQRAIRDFLFNQIKNFQGENVIFDRAMLDNYVYSLAQHQLGNIKKKFINETKKVMYASLNHIDRLIFIPTAADIVLISDKLRDINRPYIDHINKLFLEEILELARQSPIPVWVITGSRETRLKTIGEKLNQQSASSL